MSLHDRSIPIHDQVSSQTYDVPSGFVTSSATAVQSPLMQGKNLLQISSDTIAGIDSLKILCFHVVSRK